MNTNNHVFFSWEERRVSKEKGRCAVHYYLKDSLESYLPWGSRSVGGSRSSGIRKSIPGNQLEKVTLPTCPKLKTKIPSSGLAGIQLVEPQFKLSFEVGDNLAVLRRDSGLRGCWFRCKVLKVSEKCLKVQYDDIQDYDGPDKLKEWVSSYRVADSDKLGMRCTGRLTIRPRPPEDFSDCSFEVGAAVDAWWSDGWWECVVVYFDVYGSGHLQVFFPGENRLLEIPKKNVWISRDWIDNKWVEVNGKKDIKSFISSSLNDVSKCSIKEPGNCEKQMAPKLVAPEDKKLASTSEHLANKQATDVLKLEDKQATDVLKLKKRWSNDFLAGK
ncbi:putative calponin -like proteiny domain-containing protein-like [Capsicum annuum]|nr:putative calponin -like proteiny domain-containing protein-like [Capsicum annuum]